MISNDDKDSVAYYKERYNISLREHTTDVEVANDIFVRESCKHICIGKVKNIIDAGANVGCASVYFAMKYPHAKIIAIEPDDGNFQQLVENTRLYPNVIPVKAGLWGCDEPLFVADNGFREWGRQTFAIPSDVLGESKTAVDGVTVRKLMELYGIDHIDIFKIDIEGAEKSLFEGDIEWLGHVNVIGLEIHDRVLSGCSNAFYNAMIKYPFFSLHVHLDSPDLILKNRNYKVSNK